jgi:hypothetical protein
MHNCTLPLTGFALSLCLLTAAPGADAPAPAAAPEMRQVWQPPASPFIRQWLICGQFPAPSPTDNGLSTDYLSDHGGEAAITPSEGLTHKGPGGVEYKWVRYDSPVDVIDIAAALKTTPADNSVSYAFATMSSDKDTKALLALGSDDGVMLYVNGQSVFTHVIGRAAKPDDDAVEIDLRKGENALLFKIQNGSGGVGVCARLADLHTISQRPAALTIEKSPDPNTLAVQLDSAFFQRVPSLSPAVVELVAAGGEVVASRTAPRGSALSFDLSGAKDGAYELRCTSTTPTGKRVVSHTPYYKGDMLTAAKAVLARAANPAPGDLTTPMLAELVLDRLGGKLDGLNEVPAAAVGSLHSALMEVEELELARAGTQAQVRPYGFVRLAYVDPIDDSVQFCRAYPPAHYDPAKQWPMVVSLHGYNPANPRYVDWWSVDQRHHALADNHDVIVIEPHGRGNTSYAGLGRLDVLRCIELARSTFSVDPERVLLMGYSMGGWGTWQVGTRHPDLFAGVAPVFGGTDYRVAMSPDELAKLTPFARLQAERESSFVQAESLLTTPIFINHGDADELVPVKFSQYAAQMLQRWGYNVRYWEHPGLGHSELGCEDEVMRWFLNLRRVQPSRVRLRAAELKAAHAHWVSVQQRQNVMDLVVVEAAISGANTITLSTSNVLEIVLTPPPALIDPAKPVTVVWNDAEPRTLTPEDGRMVLRASGYSPAGLVKTPQCEGPIADYINAPFVCVVGTVSEDPDMRLACQAQAQQTADGWDKWQHARLRLVKDAELTEADMARYNLLLIGGPEANLVTRKLIDQLPLKIDGPTVTIDGHAFQAPSAAVGMIYPNPLNSQRYVMVGAATSAAAMYYNTGANDSVDFFIADGHIGDWRNGIPDERVLIASGFFDSNWRYSDQSTVIGDPELRTNTLVRKAPRYLVAPADVGRLMLSDLLPAEVQGSFMEMRRDLNWNNKPIMLGGKRYDSGIAVNIWREATCAASFDLSGTQFTRLRATIGIETDDPAKIDARQKERTRVIFLVKADDGKELYRTPAFLWDSQPQEIDVDIRGVKTLRLEVTGEAMSSAATSVDWADVRIEK